VVQAARLRSGQQASRLHTRDYVSKRCTSAAVIRTERLPSLVLSQLMTRGVGQFTLLDCSIMRASRRIRSLALRRPLVRRDPPCRLVVVPCVCAGLPSPDSFVSCLRS